MATETKKKLTVKEKKELNSIIPLFGEEKAQMDEHKKLSDTYNKQIKALMCRLPEAEWKDYSANGYSVSYREDQTTTLIEDALITLLKEKGLAKGIVKKKEYVDAEALESAMYHGDIPKEVVKEMEKCQKVTTRQVLTIKKEK